MQVWAGTEGGVHRALGSYCSRRAGRTPNTRSALQKKKVLWTFFPIISFDSGVVLLACKPWSKWSLPLTRTGKNGYYWIWFTPSMEELSELKVVLWIVMVLIFYCGTNFLAGTWHCETSKVKSPVSTCFSAWPVECIRWWPRPFFLGEKKRIYFLWRNVYAILDQ